MAEHSEHPTEGAGEPGDRTNPVGGPHPPAPGDRPEAASEQPAAPADRPVAPAAYASGGGGGDTIEGGHGPSPRTARFRRWSGNNGVRMGGLALVAGLVGGLVGGGIVAAFSDDGHDRQGPVRFEREMPRGGPGFRAPRYWMPRGGGRLQPDPRRPGQAPQPVPPTPSPTTTG